MSIIDRVKFDGLYDRPWLVYKYPSESLSNATQLIVGEGQIAVFYKGGRALDIFGPGTYTLTTDNIPGLRAFINLPYGGKTPFTAEFYYLNSTTKLDLYWGTKDPIQIIDPKYNVKLRVRAFGQFGFRIENYSLFLTELIGTLGANQVCDYNKISQYFKGVLIIKLKTIIAAEIIKNNISVLEIAAYLENISKVALEKITDEFSKYGIRIVNFFIESVNFPDEDFEMINSILADKAAFDLIGDNRYHTKRSFDVYEKVAENEGGVGATAANIGMGFGLANNMGGFNNLHYSNPNNQVITPQFNNISSVPQSSSNLKMCSCGKQNVSEAKFCVYCGKKFEEFKMCRVCGEKNSGGAVFCNNCGSKLGVNICPNCKNVNEVDARFCTNCGTKIGGM